MNMTRRSLLGALGALAAVRMPTAFARAGSAKNLIVVFAGGGWDPTYVFDPKPDSPFVATGEGDYGAFGSGALWLDPGRPNVTEFFSRYGDISSVVNGISVPSVAHGSCTTRILTGSRDVTRPDIGAIVGRELGLGSPMPYLDIGGGARPGNYGADLGYMGRNNQLRNLVLEEEALAPVALGDWERHFASSTESELIRAFVAGRASRDAAVRGASGINAQRLNDFLVGQERSHELPNFASFFAGVGEGRTFEDQALTAVEALSVGLSRAAFIEAGTDFDTHADNFLQVDEFELAFAGMIGLLEALEGTPSAHGGQLIDDTVVLLLSEMGRTPVVNDDGGKDHWPYTSCVIAGGGVKGHQVIGATDETQVGVPIDMTTGAPTDAGVALQSEHVLAGVLDLLGISPEPHFPGVEVFRAFHA